MFIEERREYVRIPTNIDCILYYDSKEYEGVIKDISETGLKIEIIMDIDLPDFAQISFIDPETEEIINERINIIRNHNNEYGCHIRGSIESDFYKYVICKKARDLYNLKRIQQY